MTEVEIDELEFTPRVGESDFFKLNVANHIGSLGSAISLHTGDPGSTGANALSGVARLATTWGAAAVATSGSNAGMAVITGSKVTFGNVPSGVSITHYGVWTATSGGTFLYGRALTPVAFFTVPGNIELTPSHAYGLL